MKDFDSFIASEDLNFVNHNGTDFEAFRKYSSEMRERYERVERVRDDQARKRNFLKWREMVPERWRDASFSTFHGVHVSSVSAAKRLIKDGQRSFYIVGDPTSGKTFLAYAIIRPFVASGRLKPSQIKVITENDLIALATGGFETREKYDNIFNPEYKCFLFDSAGAKDNYDSKREQQAVSRLTEEVYNRSALFIVTSHMAIDLYASGLTVSAEAKFMHMMNGGIIYTGQPTFANNDPRKNKVLDVDEFNNNNVEKFSTKRKGESWKSLKS